MEMKMMHVSMKHLLLYGFVSSEKPYIHGFSSEDGRDNSFEHYIETGSLVLKDENLEVEETFEPLFVIRADVADGALKTYKGEDINE